MPTDTGFMNLLKYDAMCVGNHEFDLGQEKLYDFFEQLQFPVISSNMDLRHSHSRLAHSKVQPYIIMEKYNLGIIGYITKTTGSITVGTGDIDFLDPIPIVQRYIDELHSKGIKRIIALSHNGYFEDQELAANTNGLQLIVGGHSHSLLLDDVSAPGVVGRYPTAVTGTDGKTTYVVQAHRFGDYLGNVDLEWNEDDDLISIVGNPILLDQSVAQDQEVHAEVQALKAGFASMMVETLAKATSPFPSCSKVEMECAMGQVISECMLGEMGGSASVSFINRGGIRAAFGKGNITIADITTVLPFDDPIVTFDVTGKELFDILEGVSHRRNLKTGNLINSIPYWSGIRYEAELSESPRVQRVEVQGEPLNLNKIYTIVTRQFLTDGGNNILSPLKPKTHGRGMVDLMQDCLKRKGTISPIVDGRAVEVQ
jgi:2',3'-cyclic-nucleotide 2'-phosphodiesterase (5'-nucleotidase family)